MRKVQKKPGLLFVFSLLVLVGSACSTPSLPAEVPLEIPELDPPTERRQPRIPEGYVADPMDKVFHRMACPECTVDPARRMFFVTPFDALNEGYAPCTYCDPMRGWQ